MTRPQSAVGNSEYLVYGLVAEEVRACLRAGRTPDVDALARDHPELAEQIRQLVPTLTVMYYVGHKEGAEQSAAHSGFCLAVGDCWGEAGAGKPLGDFRIRREVGRGGMGIVYEAEQLSLRRRVALKVLPFTALLDPRHLQRFLNEAQAAAQLHHTNIVPVYAVGSERGVHYYAMQFIEGQTVAELIRALRRKSESTNAPAELDRDGLAELTADILTAPYAPASSPEPATEFAPAAPLVSADDKQVLIARPGGCDATLPAVVATERAPRDSDFYRRVANLGVQAADALEHAHQLGIVHRDIKPANLLLDHRGHLWVTDFGLAQVQNEVSLTMTGDIVGTLRYMSPEQALARRGSVDHRTDVYSLGATLYELLTLQPIFSGRERHELLRQIAFEEPRLPRSVERNIPAELETIVCKALSKSADERYASAQDLADDLRRFLEDKPIRARRPTLVQRARKLCRRHQAVVIAAAIAAVLILCVAVVALAVSNRLITEEQNRTDAAHKETEAAREQLVAGLYYQTIALVERERSTRNVRRAEQLLAQCPVALRGWEWDYLRRLRYGSMPALNQGSHLYGLAISPDGRCLAGGGSDGLVKLWDAPTGRELRTLSGHVNQVRCVTFSPDGCRLASAAWDGLVIVWDVATGERLLTLHHGEFAYCTTFTPDGKRILTGGDPSIIYVWDAATGQRLHALPGHTRTVRRLVFNREGSRMASGAEDCLAKLWDAATWTELVTLPVHATPVRDLAFSPDGRTLAVACGQFFMQGDDGEIRIWDTRSARQTVTLRNRSAPVWCLAFSPNGQRLFSGGEDATLKVWDLATGMEALTLRGHSEAVWCVACSPDGCRLYSGSGDHTVRVWDATPLAGETHGEHRILPAHNGRVTTLAFSPDGQRLVSGGIDRAIHVWNVGTGERLITLPNNAGPVHDVAFSRDGQRLAAAYWSSGSADEVSGAVLIWDARTWQQPLPAQHARLAALSIAFTADGRRVAAASRALDLCDAATGERLRSYECRGLLTSVAISADGMLAAADVDGGVTVWNLGTGAAEAAELVVSAAAPAGLLGPTGIYGATTGRPEHSLAAHAGRAFRLAFSPDGGRLASVGVDGVVRVWDTATWREAPAPRSQAGALHALVWTPDGRRLATAGDDAIVRIWDARTNELSMTCAGHPDAIHALAFSPDGRWLASGGMDGTIRIWDAARQTESRGAAVRDPGE